MIDTLVIEKLIEAMEEYNDAKTDEREAYNKYDGHSWGYHGDYYIRRRTQAAADLKETFSQLIQEIVAEIKE